jgi:hypothetical protein
MPVTAALVARGIHQQQPASQVAMAVRAATAVSLSQQLPVMAVRAARVVWAIAALQAAMAPRAAMAVPVVKAVRP